MRLPIIFLNRGEIVRSVTEDMMLQWQTRQTAPGSIRFGRFHQFQAQIPIPWTLAGGLLGPLAAAGIGILSGIIQGVWDTHSFFTMLELGLIAAMFAAAGRQRYRTSFFRWLRVPLVGAVGLVLVHAFLFVLGAFFTTSGTALISQRLDYAFSNLLVSSLAFAGEMLVAGLVAQIVSSSFPRRWGGTGSLQPSPAERSIETRFIQGTGTIIILLLFTLIAGDWIVAGRAARNSLQEREAAEPG